MSAYLYRCKKRAKSKNGIRGKQCDARNALPNKLDEYEVPPKCWKCKKELGNYIDTWQRGKNRENTCRCDGFPDNKPHRKCSRWNHPRLGLIFCNERELTEDDYIDLESQRR